jgi:hypothetical protein
MGLNFSKKIKETLNSVLKVPPCETMTSSDDLVSQSYTNPAISRVQLMSGKIITQLMSARS